MLKIANSIKILEIYPKSFRANLYTSKPFRIIGLIDADIEYYYGVERVTLAFYRSSGTYSGKTKGLWYPIVGIKTQDGDFTEFTEYLNNVLTKCTKEGKAKEGWLAKSLFFLGRDTEGSKSRGYSNGKHYNKLLNIGMVLRDLYEKKEFHKRLKLDPETLNKVLAADRIYTNNVRSQRENFERLIEDIYIEETMITKEMHPQKEQQEQENTES